MPRCNEQVKRLRMQLQLSQNRMAGRAGLDGATYRRAEGGREKVTELTIEKIAAAFSALLKRPILATSLTMEEPDSEVAA